MWSEADPYLYRVNPQLYNLANESKLAAEAAKIKCSVIRKIEDQLADTELKELLVDDLVNKQNAAAELVYLFEAILEKGQHL